MKGDGCYKKQQRSIPRPPSVRGPPMRVRERKGWEASFHKSELVFLSYGPSSLPFPVKRRRRRRRKGEGEKMMHDAQGKKSADDLFIWRTEGWGRRRLSCAEAFFMKRESSFSAYCELDAVNVFLF